MEQALQTDPIDAPGLTGVIDRLRILAGGRSHLSVSDIVDGLGRTTLLPLLLVPALIVVSPLSGVPLLSTVCGLIIALVAVQLFFRSGPLWLPAWVMRRRIGTARLLAGLDRIEPLARWLDAHAHDRLSVLVVPPLNLVARMVCVLCGAAMPFLELVPFSSTILASAVVLITLGFLARDGFYALVGLGFACVGVSIPFFLVSKAADL